MIIINSIHRNKEVWRKLLNSVSKKYNCGVDFSITAGKLGFEGDYACAREIVKEAMALINGSANTPLKVEMSSPQIIYNEF